MALSANQISSLRALANHKATSKYQFEIASQKLYVKPIKTEKKETELNFPHNAPPNGAPVSLSWNLSGRNEPKIMLTHGTQLTCFLLQIDSFSSFNWIVEKIINLEEISSFVITFPRTNLILAALSPDCTAPFKELIYTIT